MKINSYRIEMRRGMFERVVKIHLSKAALKAFLAGHKDTYDSVTIWEEKA